MKFVHTKSDRDASLVLIYAKKSSKSLCKILPPFIMGTLEVENIYKKANTKSLVCPS